MWKPVLIHSAALSWKRVLVDVNPYRCDELIVPIIEIIRDRPSKSSTAVDDQFNPDPEV